MGKTLLPFVVYPVRVAEKDSARFLHLLEPKSICLFISFYPTLLTCYR